MAWCEDDTKKETPVSRFLFPLTDSSQHSRQALAPRHYGPPSLLPKTGWSTAPKAVFSALSTTDTEEVTLFTRTMRRWSCCIREAVRLESHDNETRRRRYSMRPSVEALEVRALPSVNPIIGDVFYIDMENHNLTQPSSVTSPQQLEGNPAAPYLNSLMTPGNLNAAQTSFASNYQNAGVGIHPSEPNYIWQEGGSNFGQVGNDFDPYAPNGLPSGNNVNLIAQTGNNPPNLSGLLQAAYGTAGWHSYQEDMQYDGLSVPTVSATGTIPGGGTNPYNGSTLYNFAVKHDGTLFYTDTNGGTLTGPGPAGSTNPEAPYYSPLGQLTTNLAVGNLARYNLITPNQYNDMHTPLPAGFTYHGTHYTQDQAAVAQGDNFLSMVIPQIMASKAYKHNGVIVIWFDETEGGDTSAETVAEIVISPLAKGNAYNSTLPYTHSSDLKSLEELFGVYAPGGGFLGGANAATTNDLSDMFVPGLFTPSTISGNIFKNSGNDGQVVAGLTLVLTGYNDAGQFVTFTTTTAADGSYSFAGLLPGVYSVSAPGAKKDPGISNITLGVAQTLGDEDFSLLGPDSHQ
jgi:phosphatidylinositol-3-phosphatase